jgi:hypothetical protein
VERRDADQLARRGDHRPYPERDVNSAVTFEGPIASAEGSGGRAVPTAAGRQRFWAVPPPST